MQNALNHILAALEADYANARKRIRDIAKAEIEALDFWSPEYKSAAEEIREVRDMSLKSVADYFTAQMAQARREFAEA